MEEMLNMDSVSDIEEGVEPEPEPAKPNDVGTQARCLLPLLAIPGVVTGDTLEVRQ